MAAKDLITFDELRARLVELEETRKTAHKELARLRSHEEYLLSLERERDIMLDSLEAVAPDALDSLTPEQRHQWYKMLKTAVAINADGTLEIGWAGAPEGEAVCEMATLSDRGVGAPHREEESAHERYPPTRSGHPTARAAPRGKKGTGNFLLRSRPSIRGPR
jgi:hypothetical protein